MTCVTGAVCLLFAMRINVGCGFYTPLNTAGDLWGPDTPKVVTIAENTVSTFECKVVKVRAKVYSYLSYNKYICRNPCGSWDLTKGDMVYGYDSVKVSEVDGNTIQVKWEAPKVSDSGVYWCCVERTGRDYCSEVTVIVVPSGLT